MDKVIVHGVELVYERTGSGRTPLVLVHGYPLDHTIWKDVVPLLEADFDLILPDLRGFGQSKPVQSHFTMKDMAADILGILDRLGLGKVCIAGHSMGGYISLAFARNWPERVMGLGLVASQARADTPERKQARYSAAEAIMANGVEAVALDMAPRLSPLEEVRAFVRDLIIRQAPVGMAGALRAMAERQDAILYLQGPKFPVVLVHGSADVLIPVEMAHEVQAACPDARLVELPGVGHMPMMEAPQAVAAALKSLQ